MKSNVLAIEFEDRTKKHEKYLKKLSRTQKISLVHKFRVNIKFLRGIIQIIGLLNNDEAILEKIKKSFKKPYGILGDIRESQVNSSLAESYIFDKKTLRNYQENLEFENKKNNLRLKKALKASKIKQQAFYIAADILKNTPEKNIKERIFTYIVENATSIEMQLADLTEEEALHDIRKELKAIKAVYKSIYDANEAYWQTFANELLAVEVEIGNWHDKVVLRDSLIQFLAAKPKYQIALLNAIRLLEAENLLFVVELPVLLEKFLAVIETLKTRQNEAG